MTTSGPPIAQRQLGDDLPVDLRLTPEPGGALAGLPDVGSPTLNGARSNHDDQPRACPISCSARSMAFGTTTSMIPVVCMTAAEAVMFHAYSANATGGSPPAPSKVGTEPFGGEHLAQRVVVTGGLLLAGVPIRVGHARVLLKNLLRRPRNDHWPWPHRRVSPFARTLREVSDAARLGVDVGEREAGQYGAAPGRRGCPSSARGAKADQGRDLGNNFSAFTRLMPTAVAGFSS